MRALQISGVILIAIGLWFIIRPPTYTREESVFKAGDLEARVQETRPLPGWIGGAALGAGVVLVVVGFYRKR
jgi:hypothetical protein